MRSQRRQVRTTIRGFGGVVQTWATDTIPANMLSDALDYLITRDLELMPRPGFKLFAEDGAADGLPVLAVIPANMDGVLRYMVGTNNTIYDYDPSTDTWTSIYSIPEADRNGRPAFALVNPATNPTLVIGNGKMHPQKATFNAGTGLWTVSATGGDTPHGRPFAHMNYVGMRDIAGFPGRVQFAWYPGDPDTWVVGSVIHNLEVIGTVTGVFPFANGLVIFTMARAYFFVGDPSNPSGMPILSDSVGCIAHDTIADCGGILTWASQAGVMVWTGGGTFPSANLSSPDNPAMSSIARDYDRIAWTELGSLIGCYYPAERLYLLTGKTQIVAAGETAWRTWTYDFRSKAWMPWSAEGTAMAAVIDPTTGRQILVQGTAEGALRYWATGSFVDEALDSADNVEYEYWASGPDSDMGVPEYSKDFRSVVISTTGKYKDLQPGNRQLKMYFRGEFERFSTDEITLSTLAGGFVLDVNKLDIDKLGDVERFLELIQPLSLRAKHVNWFVTGKGDVNAVPILKMVIAWRQHAGRRTIMLSKTGG